MTISRGFGQIPKPRKEAGARRAGVCEIFSLTLDNLTLEAGQFDFGQSKVGFQNTKLSGIGKIKKSYL